MKLKLKETIDTFSKSGYIKILNIIALVLFGPVLFGIVFFGTALPYPDDMKPVISIPWILFYIITAVFITGVLFVLKFLENKIGNAKKTNYIFYALLFVFALLTYFGIYYFSRQIAFYVPWDVSVVRGNALNFARGEHLDSEVYFQIYENNIPIVYVLGKLYKKAVEHFDYNNMELIWIQVSCIMSVVAILLTVWCVKITTKSTVLSVFAYFCSIALIGLSGWNMVPYTDSYGIMFPIMSVILYICYINLSNKETGLSEAADKKDKRKRILVRVAGVVCIALSIVSCVAGCLIKPTIAIVYIAILLIGFVRLLHNIKKEWLGYLVVFICLILALLGKKSLFQKMADEIGIVRNEHIAASVMSYLYMGQNEERCGMYNSDDATVFGEFQLEDTAVRDKVLFQRSIKRMAEKGVLGCPFFWYKKMVMTFNESTFGFKKEVWMDGNYSPPIDDNNKITEITRKIYWVYGNSTRLYCTIVQMIWISVLTGIIFSFIKKDKNVPIAFLKTIFIGIFLYQMLFEARARYLYVFLPLFIVLSMSGYVYMVELFSIVMKKIKKR